MAVEACKWAANLTAKARKDVSARSAKRDDKDGKDSKDRKDKAHPNGTCPCRPCSRLGPFIGRGNPSKADTVLLESGTCRQ